MTHDGSASGFLPTATMWGISEGHVFNCTKRVIEALCRLKNDFVQWPSERARIRESLTRDKMDLSGSLARWMVPTLFYIQNQVRSFGLHYVGWSDSGKISHNLFPLVVERAFLNQDLLDGYSPRVFRHYLMFCWIYPPSRLIREGPGFFERFNHLGDFISGFFLGYIGSLSTQSRLQQHSSTSFYLVSFLIEIEIDGNGNTLIVSDTKPLND